MSYPIPADALDDRLAITGTSGSGKTYATMGAIARLLGGGARVIGVDPLGVMWGLRIMADGKTASPYNVVIFGGPHGDLPINEHSGALIGETVATMRESCIIDLSQLGTKAAERRFMLAFLTALYRNTKGSPVHLVFDEADMWAPQKLLDKDGDAAKLLGMMETIVRRGRVKGFIPWLLTQRPAVLSKDVLSQADGLVALKLTSKQDRDAIGGWIEGQADKEEGKAILAQLPSYQVGTGVVWIPGRAILNKDAAFPANKTFDSSRAPKRGEKRQTAALKPLDLGALKEKLATVEAEAKASDPKALKAEVAKLRAELARVDKSGSKSGLVAQGPAQPKFDQKAQERALAAAREEGAQAIRDQIPALLDAQHQASFRAGFEFLAARRAVFEPDMIPARKPMPGMTIKAPAARPASRAPATASAMKPALVPAARTTVAPRAPGGGSSGTTLPPGERAVLIAAAQFDGVDREQLSVLTGYKRSSRDAYIQRLREKALIEVSGSTISPTPAGFDALPADYEPLPTGQALQEYWLGHLPEGERRVLEVLIEAYPEAIERQAIDSATGYKRSSRDAYLQRMKAKRLWTPENGGVRMADALA